MSGSWQPAPWPSPRSSRPRVVIESDDAAAVWADRRSLTDAGFDVATCGGPGAHDGRPCPLVATGTCALVAGADVVLSELRLAEPQSRAVIAALTARHPCTAVVVEVDAQELARHGPTLAGCRIVPYPMSTAALIEQTAAALGEQQDLLGAAAAVRSRRSNAR